MIQIGRSFDMLVFKNDKRPMCVLSIPKGTGHMSHTLGPAARSLLAVRVPGLTSAFF